MDPFCRLSITLLQANTAPNSVNEQCMWLKMHNLHNQTAHTIQSQFKPEDTAYETSTLY